MEMTYDGALVMPKMFIVMNNDEMEYLEGGTLTTAGVLEIVVSVITIYGASYAAGRACGERLYYAGMNSSAKWAKYKWKVRTAVVGGAGTVGLAGAALGAVFMGGLESQLYSMM